MYMYLNKARFSMVMLLGFVHVRFLILPGAQDTNNLSFDGKSSNWVVNKTQFP